jgi:hypothetical protein
MTETRIPSGFPLGRLDSKPNVLPPFPAHIYAKHCAAVPDRMPDTSAVTHAMVG